MVKQGLILTPISIKELYGLIYQQNILKNDVLVVCSHTKSLFQWVTALVQSIVYTVPIHSYRHLYRYSEILVQQINLL